MKGFLNIVAFIVGIGVLLFGLSYGAWSLNNYFQPKYEQTRYNTFKQSQAYNDGMLRELSSLQMEYMKSPADQKAALSAVIIHKFEVYDITRLPPDLQLFYHQVKGY